jgi:diguanylate cyclase (GGDEF)-like protein
MLQAALSREGYDVTTAANAEEAFVCLADRPPAVAITDINLPGTDGLEICRRFSDEHGIEVILITGDDRTYSYEDAAAAGACDFLLKPIRLSELILRVERAIATRRIRLERDETVRVLHRLSITDELTGLYNSRHLYQELQREIARTRRYGHALSLIVLDLDHFKRVNDTQGHQAGDQVLREVGACIRRAIRQSDTAYRHGGEEFAVILPETAANAGLALAERLRQATERDVNHNDTPVRVTVSLGVAEWSNDENAQSLLYRADTAMYAAKHAGRNRARSATGSDSPRV